jgi:hypothetical protein
VANLERTAMNYALLFAVGIIGMFVAHLLAFLASHAANQTNSEVLLPYWWGYPLVFPALASVWMHFNRTFWLGTAIVVCLAPTIYFMWYAANSIESSLGRHPFTVLFVTFAATAIIAFLAARHEHLPTT